MWSSQARVRQVLESWSYRSFPSSTITTSRHSLTVRSVDYLNHETPQPSSGALRLSRETDDKQALHWILRAGFALYFTFIADHLDHSHQNPRDLRKVVEENNEFTDLSFQNRLHTLLQVKAAWRKCASYSKLHGLRAGPAPSNLGSSIHNKLQNGSHHTAVHALFLRGASYSGTFQLQHAIATPTRHRNPPNMAPSSWLSDLSSQRD
ncbi:hypothetical protein CNYM01_06429 [Colletotrichum nymphaeae SA-01]|uniref:Uncharacterized protein n=1 Tax=Colletotrichum nymphaeae SA-01 TaxID=1460502 RepID=A0A135SBU5_9PEZI|nr:hypothetical protein CNYM01_06429 [Colletotrichum nymphaeae SA-01]